MSWADMAELEESSPGFPLFRPDTLTDSFSILGFINVGLLTGQSKLTGRDALKSLPLSGWHSQSVLTALNPAQAHRWFIHYHLDEIQKQTRFGGTTLNLFAHPLKGGLGFSVPPGIEARFSPEQRRLAQALFLSASYTYEGLEEEFELPSLVSVVSPSTGAPLLGHKIQRAMIQLYPANTPLTPGRVPFEDTTSISPIVLTQSYGVQDPSDDRTKVRCRLTGRQIRQLTKRWKDTVDLHPVEDMTFFPFVLVRLDESSEGQGIYSPEVVFQDIQSMEILDPTPPNPPPTPELGLEETIPSSSEVASRNESINFLSLADWETQEYIPRIPIVLDEEVVKTDDGGLPDGSYVGRSSVGRKRRRHDLATPNAFRPGAYGY
jgi:hypothetical protein